MSTELSIKHNIRIIGLDAGGREIYRHEGHNIWLDNGRTWISQALAYDFYGYTVHDPPYDPGTQPGDAEPNPAGPPAGTYTRVVTAIPGSPPWTTTAGVKMPYLPFYVGVGIGGNQQTGPIPSTGTFPGNVGDDYPGTNTYSDADPTVPGLERPVRVRTGTGWARWLQPFSSVSWGTSTPYLYVKFTCSFEMSDINPASLVPGSPPLPGSAYATVPLSEIALYRWDPSANGNQPPPNPVPPGTAYVPPGYVTGAALAYETFPTFPKTASNSLVVEWTLLFV